MSIQGKIAVKKKDCSIAIGNGAHCMKEINEKYIKKY